MKILHVISSVNPTGGGPMEGVRQLSVVAQSKGHEVNVASFDPPGADYLSDFPVPVFPLGPAFFAYCFSPVLVKWLRKNASAYDIVIVNGIWQYHSFAVHQALKNSSTPYVLFTHGMLDPWFKRTYPLKHFKKWLYWPWAEYRVLRDAAAVIFTCEEEKILARQSFWLYSAKEVVVNYGTAQPTGDDEAQKKILLNCFPGIRDKRIVLFMGRIHAKKGCDLILRSFAAVLASDPSWHLVMAGPDQTGLKSFLSPLAAKLGIADRVTWTGMVGGDLKAGLMKSADAFFLPSHQENFGIAVAEALACGLPVLISDKVNIWREITTDKAGFVANDDLEGACHLLKSWKNLDDADKSTMRTRARSCFQNRFEIRAASEHLISILRDYARPQNTPLGGDHTVAIDLH